MARQGHNQDPPVDLRRRAVPAPPTGHPGAHQGFNRGTPGAHQGHNQDPPVDLRPARFLHPLRAHQGYKSYTRGPAQAQSGPTRRVHPGHAHGTPEVHHGPIAGTDRPQSGPTRSLVAGVQHRHSAHALAGCSLPILYLCCVTPVTILCTVLCSFCDHPVCSPGGRQSAIWCAAGVTRAWPVCHGCTWAYQ